MAYCSEEDILQMIPEVELAALTSESGDLPDPEIVAGAIRQGDAEIDSYVGRRYAVPLAPAPAQIKALAVDLAIYHLYSRRSIIPVARREKHEAAVAWLRKVAAGEVVLTGAAGTTPELSREAPEISANPRCFTRDGLGDW